MLFRYSPKNSVIPSRAQMAFTAALVVSCEYAVQGALKHIATVDPAAAREPKVHWQSTAGR
jgi:hypothetical protein